MQFIKVKCGRCLTTQSRCIFSGRKSLGSKCVSLPVTKGKINKWLKVERDPSRKQGMLNVRLSSCWNKLSILSFFSAFS